MSQLLDGNKIEYEIILITASAEHNWKYAFIQFILIENSLSSLLMLILAE